MRISVLVTRPTNQFGQTARISKGAVGPAAGMAKMGGASSGKSAFGRSRAAGPIKAIHAQRGSDALHTAHQLEFTNHGHLRKAVQHIPDHNADHGILPTTAAPESPFGRSRGLSRSASHDLGGLMPHRDRPESPLPPAQSDHRVRRAGVCQPGTRCVRELQPVLHVTCASCACAAQCPRAWVSRSVSHGTLADAPTLPQWTTKAQSCLFRAWKGQNRRSGPKGSACASPPRRST